MQEPLEASGRADEFAIRPRRRQLWLVGGRLLVATLLLGGSLLFAREGELSSFSENALMFLIASTFAISLAVAVVLPGSRRPELVAAAQIGWDLTLVTGLVYLFGGAASGFSFLYGVVILAAALVVGPRATQLTTAAALTLYVTVGLGLANEWIPEPPGPPELRTALTIDELALAVLRNLVGLVLVGVLAANLADRIRRAGGELRKAAASVAGYARLNEDILRSLSSGLVTTDLEGTIRNINPAGAKILGAEVEEIAGRPISDVLPVEAADGRLLDVERAEGTAIRLDGSVLPVGYSCSPLRDTEDRVQGSLVVFQDLSELARLRDQAERAERLAALGRLAAGLAHEIRNPLGSIAGSVELVREAEELSDEDRRLLTLVLDETDRLNDLVTTMLEVGRPREPNAVDVDLGALAADVAKVAARGGRVEITLDVPSDPVRVHADPAQLRQVLWNLVKNALQFSPAGEVVRISVGWDDESRPCISVSDAGPGIPPEDLEHLFDMFFSKRRHGVGLGLALVRQIVEAHGGAVTVDTRADEGTRFTVHLPAARTHAATAEPAV